MTGPPDITAPLPVAEARPGTPAVPLSETLARLPLSGKIQNLAYTVLAIQWATGVVTAVYVLITQARYFGVSLKHTWDHLAPSLHAGAIPGIGGWLLGNWPLARHLYGRDIPESVLAYALVAMILPALVTHRKAKVPWLHRMLARAGMPSPYQGQLGRHPDTSGWQYLLLPPSMLLAALPGVVASSVLIFGGIAGVHRLGVHPGWLTPTGTVPLGPVHLAWVPVLIGLAGGRLAGHTPAVKAGADIQRRYLGKRLALAYAADDVLARFKAGAIGEAQARDMLTRMRRTAPPAWYPATYRHWYDQLLADRAPVKRYTRWATIGTIATVTALIVLGGWGVYLQRWGIHHGFWLP